MTRAQFLTRWLASSAAIILTLAGLHQLGAGDLATPPLSLDGIATWLGHTDTIVVAFTLVRVVALCFGGYLLVVLSIGCTTRCLALPRMTSFIDRLTLPWARGLLGSVALLGVMASPPAPARSPNTMVELSDSIDETVTLHLVQEAPTSAPAPPTAAAAPASDDNVWVVEPGESFWLIARAHLTEVLGTSVTDQQVTPYWRQMIELNRSRLANPDDADLLFTGQTVELPAVG